MFSFLGKFNWIKNLVKEKSSCEFYFYPGIQVIKKAFQTYRSFVFNNDLASLNFPVAYMSWTVFFVKTVFPSDRPSIICSFCCTCDDYSLPTLSEFDVDNCNWWYNKSNCSYHKIRYFSGFNLLWRVTFISMHITEYFIYAILFFQWNTLTTWRKDAMLSHLEAPSTSEPQAKFSTRLSEVGIINSSIISVASVFFFSWKLFL